MKKINFLAITLVAILFASCGKAYKVSVELENNETDGKIAYLYVVDPLNLEETKLVDSTTVKGAKFVFETDKYADIELPAQAVISFVKLDKSMMEMPEIAPVMFFLEKGNIKISLGKEKLSLSGTPTNDKYNEFLQMIEKVQADGGPSETFEEDASALFMTIIQDNINNNIGHTFILSNIAASMLTAEHCKMLLMAIPEDFKTKYENAPEVLEAMEKKSKSAMTEAVDAQLVKADASTVQLMDIVKANKYVLIDFWASWCPPCIQEVPNLKVAYGEYKDKGFEIVGISVDREADEWQEAIKNHQMDWLHFNDAEGLVADMYGVMGIPHTLLVDSEGKIVGKNFRGEQLSKKLAELLK